MRAAAAVLAPAVLSTGRSLLELDGDPPLYGRWVGTVSDSTDASVPVTFEPETATMSYVGTRTTDDQIDGTMTADGDSRSLALRRQR